jgi:hypothetical protein
MPQGLAQFVGVGCIQGQGESSCGLEGFPLSPRLCNEMANAHGQDQHLGIVKNKLRKWRENTYRDAMITATKYDIVKSHFEAKAVLFCQARSFGVLPMRSSPTYRIPLQDISQSLASNILFLQESSMALDKGTVTWESFYEHFIFTQKDVIVSIESEHISPSVATKYAHLLCFRLSIPFKYGSFSQEALPGKSKGHKFVKASAGSESLIVQRERWSD